MHIQHNCIICTLSIHSPHAHTTHCTILTRFALRFLETRAMVVAVIATMMTTMMMTMMTSRLTHVPFMFITGCDALSLMTVAVFERWPGMGLSAVQVVSAWMAIPHPMEYSSELAMRHRYTCSCGTLSRLRA